jgi:hypothetical protein
LDVRADHLGTEGDRTGSAGGADAAAGSHDERATTVKAEQRLIVALAVSVLSASIVAAATQLLGNSGSVAGSCSPHHADLGRKLL